MPDKHAIVRFTEEFLKQPLDTETFAERLSEAMQLGFAEQQTADFLGVTVEELRSRIACDELLIRLVRYARAQSLRTLTHLIMEGDHWPAYKFLMERNHPIAPPDGKPTAVSVEPGILQPFKEVKATMTPDQIVRMPQLLALGCAVDNKNSAVEATDEPQCPANNETIPLTSPLPENSPPTPSSVPSQTSEASSPSPGPS